MQFSLDCLPRDRWCDTQTGLFLGMFNELLDAPKNEAKLKGLSTEVSRSTDDGTHFCFDPDLKVRATFLHVVCHPELHPAGHPSTHAMPRAPHVPGPGPAQPVLYPPPALCGTVRCSFYLVGVSAARWSSCAGVRLSGLPCRSVDFVCLLHGHQLQVRLGHAARERGVTRAAHLATAAESRRRWCSENVPCHSSEAAVVR